MTGQTYEQQRNKTLEKYNEFLSVLDQLPQEISARANKVVLENKYKNIKNNKFTLMVVGEAKSGKSTFINAYLKTDILPMSVEQCTSAIIKISYSEEKLLSYYTADNRCFTLEGDEAIRSFLVENAAINEQFRQIPVASLDRQIAYRKGRINDVLIKEAIEALQDDNIYNLPDEQYAASIKKYMIERSKNWQDIVIELIISYPFAEEMKDICIIDSPGVNALGQVGEITENYIANANAVVYIKCLTGQALETKSFKSFLKSKNAGRHKESLFVLLSRASDHNPAELERLVSKARVMYGNNIKPDKIIPIDSIVRIYINKFTGKTEDEIFEILKNEKEKETGSPWVRDKWMWKSSVDEFFSELDAWSGFQEINKNFELYAKQAQRIALYELLSEIRQSYKVFEARLLQELDLTEKKITFSPEQLAHEIKERQDKLDELQRDLNVSIHELEKKYTCEGGVIFQKKLDVVARVNESLAASSTMEDLEASLTSIVDPLSNFKKSLACSALDECNSKLRAKCQDKDFETWMEDILMPEFTTEDIDEIKKSLTQSKDAYDFEPRSFMGTTLEPRKRFNPDKYLSLVKNSIRQRLENMATQSESDLAIFVSKIFDKYRGKLKTSISDEKRLLKDKLDEKESIDKLVNKVAQCKSSIERIHNSCKTLDSLVIEVEDGINRR